MKSIFLLCTFLVVLANAEEFSCWVDTSYNSPNKITTASNLLEATTTSFTEIVIIAVDSDAPSTVLPDWFNPAMNRLPDFFYQASFGYFLYNNIVLKKNANNAFRMPTAYVTPFPGGCEHVHLISNMIAVLTEADVYYNYRDYDFDSDGKVYVHFTSIGPNSGGTVGECVTYNSADGVTVIVDKQSRGSDQNFYLNVFYHESGHQFFDFPDMEHDGSTSYDHYGVGSFDVMSLAGFNGVPSLYNPFFRDDRNWFHPYYIVENWENAPLQDFQLSKTCYIYNPSSISGNALPNQKFYISYHTHDYNTNYYYSAWPYKDPYLGGMMMWHIKDDAVTMSGSYYDWRRLDVDVECAHGKYKWNVLPDRVINTYEENPLTGRDSLEIRLVSGGDIIGGPYFGRPAGSSSIFYTPGDGKQFSFITNPNSNWYVKYSSQSYAQNILNGFAMKNLRKEGSNVFVDFYAQDYSIDHNVTLTKGNWYITGNISVENGCTLTLLPGTVLNFEGKFTFNVYGSLIAYGTETEPIVFTSSKLIPNKGDWQGIVLKQGMNGAEFNNCRIEYAVDGIKSENDNTVFISNSDFYKNTNGVNARYSWIDIDNCIFQENSTGIYLYSCYNSQDWNYSAIRNNTLTNNSNMGIKLYYDDVTLDNNIFQNNYYGIFTLSSDPVLMNNIIENSTKYGLYVSNNSYPDLYYNGYKGGHNRIINSGSYGVYNSSSSLADLGDFSPYYGQNKSGYNDLYNNTTYELYNANSQTLLAEGNWWGQYYSCIVGAISSSSIASIPGPKVYGNVSWCPALNGPATSGAATLSSIEGSDDESQLPDELQTGNNFEKSGNYQQAALIYRKFMLTNPENYTEYCVNKFIKNSSNYLKNIELISSIYSLLGSVTTFEEKFSLTHHLINCLISSKQYDPASKLSQELLANNLTDNQWGRLKFQSALIEIYEFENIDKGKGILKEIMNRLPAKNEYYILASEEELQISCDIVKPLSKSNAENDIEKLIPEYFEFFGNHPNPFNNTTSFGFKLPVEANVRIIIYNMSGQKVNELNDYDISPGNHSIQWKGLDENGRTLPSGMYIYRFIALLEGKTVLIKNGKMLLLK